MADKNIGSLPAASTVDDDSLLVAEQQGQAVKVTGAQFKGFAQQAVRQYVEQAQEAASDALEASEQALEAVAGIGTAVEDTKANKEAAEAAQTAAEQAQAGAGGEDQQAALDQLGGQLLVGALPLHVDADHQAHAPGLAQAGQIHGLDLGAEIVALLLHLVQEGLVDGVQQDGFLVQQQIRVVGHTVGDGMSIFKQRVVTVAGSHPEQVFRNGTDTVH